MSFFEFMAVETPRQVLLTKNFAVKSAESEISSLRP